MRRIGLLLIGFFLLLIVVGAIWGAVSPHVGWSRGNGQFVPWLPVLILILIAVLVIGRVLRRTAAPIGDVMEAANQLAAGDYTARVEARGPGDVRQPHRLVQRDGGAAAGQRGAEARPAGRGRS